MGCGASTAAPPEPPAPLPQPPVKSALKSVNAFNAGGNSAGPRGSVIYQSKELTSGRDSRLSRRRSGVSAAFDTSHIGTCTRHGIAPLPGRRGAKAKINQDRGLVCWPFNGSTAQALLCVFDGHGRHGERISEYCMRTLPGLLEAQPTVLTSRPAEHLAEQVIEMDSMLGAGELEHVAKGAGTTATAVYMRGDTCWVACSGDSRAVLGSRKGGSIVGTDLSKDHKPDDPIERARIEAAGGEVTEQGANGAPARLWAPDGSCGLAMSRSVGDFSLRGHGHVPDPDVQEFQITPAEGSADGDCFVIVASDGIWEFITSQEACEIVSTISDATAACEKLVMVAENRWYKVEGVYRDDITVRHQPRARRLKRAPTPLPI